jgi:hypothetical protein
MYGKLYHLLTKVRHPITPVLCDLMRGDLKAHPQLKQPRIPR